MLWAGLGVANTDSSCEFVCHPKVHSVPNPQISLGGWMEKKGLVADACQT